MQVLLPRAAASYTRTYEWSEAARWAGYRYETDWCELTVEEQESVLARYRITRRFEAIQAQEHASAMRRTARGTPKPSMSR